MQLKYGYVRWCQIKVGFDRLAGPGMGNDAWVVHEWVSWVVEGGFMVMVVGGHFQVLIHASPN